MRRDLIGVYGRSERHPDGLVDFLYPKKDLVAASAAPVACTSISHLDLYNLYGQKLRISEDYIRVVCSVWGHAMVQARLAEEAMAYLSGGGEHVIS